jgi:hypothetical protein
MSQVHHIKDQLTLRNCHDPKVGCVGEFENAFKKREEKQLLGAAGKLRAGSG